MGTPLRVAVLGASGYTGLELLRILLRHPRVEIAAITSEQRAGRPVGEAFPSLSRLVDLCFESADPSALAGRVDFAFAALPHATSAPLVAGLRGAGVPVVDLSADFRLHDPALYEAWYGPHKAPELLGEAVYGLPELHRDALRRTALAAAPGCYPTSMLLPLAPFLRARLVETRNLHVDAKSGVSGAGRKLDEGFLFAELDGNCRAYNVGGAHRHVPEMEQEAAALAGEEVRIAFVPQLLPTARGIATSVYARLREPLATSDARALLAEGWAGEPFVRVLPEGALPSLAAVRGSNFCDVTAVVDARTGSLVLLSALDNLVKGAAGSAVQCMNLMRGFDETAGLREAPLVP
jgi:N-acetyl-gamma-glutamyl-phosphate reductase